MSGWRSLAYRAVRPLLFRFEPERIHRLTLDGLRVAGGNPLGRAALRVAGGAASRPRPWAEPMGLRFRNRVGLGAGFDKDGLGLRGWEALGLGFVEVGTVTPDAQPGNPRPRLQRLPANAALVNRMGFNNDGAAALAIRVMRARRHLPPHFVIGANIGRGRDTPSDEAERDYLAAQRLLAPVVDYLAVNVSSPNTPGLRDLQDAPRLVALVEALARAGEAIGRPRPLLVKLAPDLAPPAFEAIVEALAATPRASGLVLSNTTLGREGLATPPPDAQAGGLSGRPLLPGTLAALRRARDIAGERLVLVASGGLAGAADVAEAYAAGADLVQLWTGLVYEGPGLIGEAAAVPYDRG